MNRTIREIFNEERLKRLYRNLQKSGLWNEHYCAPFIPYVGKNYDMAEKKILYVGKSTYDWGKYTDNGEWKSISLFQAEKMQPKELANLSTNFIERNVAHFYAGGKSYRVKDRGYYSHFWRRVYMLTTSILKNECQLVKYKRNKDDSYWCFHSIAWTNVFKIGTKDDTPSQGAPDDDMIEFLLHNFNTLPKEIKCLKPDLIIFSTGLGYDEYLKKIFPEVTITDIRGGIAKLRNVDDDALVIRTKHFQYLSNNKVKNLYSYIISALKDGGV